MIDMTQYDLISLDIFDTLLFRAAARPEDIFALTWDAVKKKDLVSMELSREEFRSLRIEMERRARNKKESREVTLEEIYGEMPAYVCEDLSEVLRTELQTEQECCYLNPEIYALVEEAHGQGKTVVLLSDMYLSAQRVGRILTAAGADMSLFDSVIVSCEEGCSKNAGRLYEVLLAQYAQIPPQRMLHIGDNRISDYEQALRKGMHAQWYDVIPDRLYSVFDYEKIRHDSPLPQMLALRKFAASKKNHYAQEIQQTAYELGAAVVGPFLSLYVSWALEKMKQLRIKAVYPMMREGYLLGRMLEEEAIDQGADISVRPIYISRKVTYIPSIARVDREEIENMIGARNLTVGEAFSMVGLPKEDFGELSEYFDTRWKESHKIRYGQSTLKEYVIGRLLENEHVAQIERYIKEQRSLLVRYLDSKIEDKNHAATMDIGFFGRIQMWMEKALELESVQSDFVHFLAIGLTGDKIYNGNHFEGYCSTTVENQDLVPTIHRSTDILEKLISVKEGSTIGYEEKNGEVVPVKGQPVENAYQDIIFQGIFDFQKAWFGFRRRKPQIAAECVANRRGALMLLHRLIDMPRKCEAQFFREIEADTNFGTAYSKSIITDENIALLKEKGADYIDKCNVSYTYEDSNIVWPRGLITLEDEFYYVRRTLKNRTQNAILRSMQEVVERVEHDGVREVALYGAGENGRQFFFMCSLYHIKVNCFIDRKESMWGTYKEGIEVMGLAEAMKRGNRNYIVTSLFSISEISDYIKESFAKEGKEAVIYSV